MRNLIFLRIFAILKRIFTKITKKIFFFNTLSVLRPIERVLRTQPPPSSHFFVLPHPKALSSNPGASHYNTNSRRVQLRNLFRFVCCTVHMHSAKQKKILRDFLFFFYSFSFYKILASAFRSLNTKDPYIKIIYYIAWCFRSITPAFYSGVNLPCLSLFLVRFPTFMLREHFFTLHVRKRLSLVQILALVCCIFSPPPGLLQKCFVLRNFGEFFLRNAKFSPKFRINWAKYSRYHIAEIKIGAILRNFKKRRSNICFRDKLFIQTYSTVNRFW